MSKFFNSPSFEPEIDAKTLQGLLDEIVGSRLKQKGFSKKSNYSWVDNTKQFRQEISYMRLKGAAGVFVWGVNINFIPVVRSTKLEYYKTGKRYFSHLWESTDEYRNSFSGGEIKKGIVSHWGYNKAKATITDLFNRNEEKIFKWLDKTNSIDNLIEITKQQIGYKNFYNIHSPRPKFVLAFLLAKANKTKQALEVFETLDMYQFNESLEVKEKIKKLLVLSFDKNSI